MTVIRMILIIALVGACKAGPTSSLQKSDHIDRPIDDSPSVQAAARVVNKVEYTIYYANETDLDDDAKAKRAAIIAAFDALLAKPEVSAADKAIIRHQKQAMLEDEANFKAAVATDVDQLKALLCANDKQGLFVFTNQLFKQGKYLSCAGGSSASEKSLAGTDAVSTAIAAEIEQAQPIYRNSPNAHPKTLEISLAQVERDAGNEGASFVLITKSHGNADNALVPPLQKALNSDWFKRYLMVLGANGAADHVTLGSEGGGLSSEGGGLGSEGSGLGSEGGGLGSEGSGLGETGSGLGGIGAGISKPAYVDLINGSKLSLTLVFLEACKTDLPVPLVAKITGQRPATKVWASDNDGLVYRTVANYGSFDLNSNSFAQSLDAVLREAAKKPDPVTGQKK